MHIESSMQTVQMTSQELNLSQHDLVTSSRGLRVGLLQPPDTVVLSCCFHRFFRSNGGSFTCKGTDSLNLLSSASPFSRCLEHCNYVFWRKIRQDIVNRLKHEPVTGSPARYQLAHILPNLIRGSARQDMPRVTTAAPEGNIVASVPVRRFFIGFDLCPKNTSLFF